MSIVKKEHIAFVTGRLAETALKSLLQQIAPKFGFDYTVVVLEISVAALMTPTWVARRLQSSIAADRVILPGYCRGDLACVESVASIPVECGPRDFRSLPRWLGKDQSEIEDPIPDGYGAHKIEIIAEINHAPDLSSSEILALAKRYRESGADVIDVGCNPGMTWQGIGDVVRMLCDEGFRVAVDTFNPREIQSGARAGAELILSIHGKNLQVARDIDCEVVAIPDNPRTLEGLQSTIQTLDAWKVPHRIDPVIEPLGFGFAESLGRYLQVRNQYPDRAMMMGIGNITELTDVDSMGVNTLLVGFCEELSIESVLTTEVIPWARSSVREIEYARRLMHFAVEKKVLPKHVDNSLICLRDPEVLEYGQEVLDELAKKIKDPNYRIFAERDQLHVMNRDGYVSGQDPFEILDSLELTDTAHAFYLGYEMAKAMIALQLGKQYHQDRALSWGFLTVEEKSHLERKEQQRKDQESGKSGESEKGNPK